MNTITLSLRSSLFTTLLALGAASIFGCAAPTGDEAEAVSEAEQAFTVPFPGATPVTLGNTTSYQPSGVAMRSGLLYMASNDGKIVRFNTATSAWTPVVTSTANGLTDFESLTVATNNQLMVGIEGVTTSKIAKVDVAGGALGVDRWNVNVAHMEAMTFVPEGNTPFGQANTTAHPGDFSGYFFVAPQEAPGRIEAYRLDRSASAATWVGGFDIDIAYQISDMSFANGVLYVLFDDQNETDLLAVYVINTNPSQMPRMLAYQKEYDLPSIMGSTANYEGLAIDGQTIYLARDSNMNPSQNGVFRSSNTLIYPQTVLPPLSW